MRKMILCWLQLHGFAVDEPFQISVHLNAPFLPLSSPPPKLITNRATTATTGSRAMCWRLQFHLQDPGVGLQEGLGRAEVESPPAAPAATAFCFGMHGKGAAEPLQNGAKQTGTLLPRRTQLPTVPGFSGWVTSSPWQ